MKVSRSARSFDPHIHPAPSLIPTSSRNHVFSVSSQQSVRFFPTDFFKLGRPRHCRLPTFPSQVASVRILRPGDSNSTTTAARVVGDRVRVNKNFRVIKKVQQRDSRNCCRGGLFASVSEAVGNNALNPTFNTTAYFKLGNESENRSLAPSPPAEAAGSQNRGRLRRIMLKLMKATVQSQVRFEMPAKGPEHRRKFMMCSSSVDRKAVERTYNSTRTGRGAKLVCG